MQQPVGLRIYNIFLLVLEDIVYSPEDFCLANGILSVLFMFCYTYMFWKWVVHTSIHIQNKVMLRNNNEKTPYELWKGSTDNNLYIKVTQGNILLIEIYVDDIFLEVLMKG